MPRPPELDVFDVRRALGAHGFTWKRTTGAHEQFEGHKPDGTRTVVTVDANDAPFHGRSKTLKSIIKHSGIPKRDFYAAAGKPLS